MINPFRKAWWCSGVALWLLPFLAAVGAQSLPAANLVSDTSGLGDSADFTGTLEVVEICYPDHAEQSFSLTDEKTGEKHKLNFAVEPAEGHLTGERVRIRGRAQGEDIFVPAQATAAAGGMEVLAAAPAPTTGFTAQPSVLYSGGTTTTTVVHKALVELLIYSDYATNYYTAADIVTVSNRFFTATGSSVNTAYLEDTYGAVGFAGDVVICYIASPSTPYTTTWMTQGDAAATAQGYPPGNYLHRVYYVSGAGGWAGLGTVGGNGGWAQLYYTDGGTACHELGHNLGFNHASTQWGNTNAWVEYGDGSDFMGANYKWQHNNAPHKIQMGWVKAQSVTNADFYKISRLEDVPATMPYPQALTLPSSSAYGTSVDGWPYYFSYKQNVGLDSEGSPYNAGLSIHRWGGGTGHPAVIAVLADGGSFTDSQIGLTVKQISHDTNSVTVAIALCPGSAQPFTATLADNQMAARTPQLIDVAANSDCNPLTVTAFDATSAMGGTIALTNNQLFYTPPGIFIGNDTFNYTVTNLLGDVSASVVTILPVSLPPYNWDANGATAGTGGTNTWNTTSATWDNGTNLWPSTGVSNIASFAGIVGKVTIAAGGVAANGLMFATDGYLIQSNTLTLNGSNPFIILETGVDARINSALGGTAGFNFLGSGTLTLDGSNTLAGPVQINAGTLQVGNGAGSGTLGSTTVTNNGALTFFRTNSFTFPNVISGSGSISQLGSGTVTLTGSNIYAGTTTISAGTLALSGGDNRLPTNTTVIYPANTILNVGTTTQTVARLTFNNGITANVDGGGKLVLAGQDLTVGSTVSSTTTLDLAGLNNFVFNSPANNVNVGGQAGGGVTALGTLTLSPNSSITANNLNVQTVGSVSSYTQSTANTGTLNLGKTNTFNVNTLNLGTSGSDLGYIQYSSAVTNPLLTIRNAAGTGRATINLGGHTTVGGPTTTTVKFDLASNATGSVLDALTGTLTIGNCTRMDTGNTENATFAMGGGTLDATTIVLGAMANNAGNYGTLNSTLTVGGGTIKVSTLTFGNHTDSNGTNISTFNLNSGATLAAQTVSLGTGTSTRAFNWNSGTIRNYDSATSLTMPSGLTLTTIAGGTHDFTIDAARTGTINSVIAGGGAMTKSGVGTATLTVANTYTNTTTINAGTLALGSAGAIATSPVITVNSGALFDVSAVSGFTIGAAQKLQGFGSVRGNMTVAGTLAPGGSIGTLTFSNNLTLTGTNVFEIARPNGGATNDQAVVIGTVTYGGALVVTNIGANALQWGDVFKLFNAGARAGTFASTNLPPLALPLYWTNKLSVDGTIAVATTINTLPANILSGVSGTNLNLSWPADHTGWRLLVQTNTLDAGLGTNWSIWPNSTNVNSISIPINQANATVFFKLVYP
jgi:autotransporter-associated beta strand protein